MCVPARTRSGSQLLPWPPCVSRLRRRGGAGPWSASLSVAAGHEFRRKGTRQVSASAAVHARQIGCGRTKPSCCTRRLADPPWQRYCAGRRAKPEHRVALLPSALIVRDGGFGFRRWMRRGAKLTRGPYEMLGPSVYTCGLAVCMGHLPSGFRMLRTEPRGQWALRPGLAARPDREDTCYGLPRAGPAGGLYTLERLK